MFEDVEYRGAIVNMGVGCYIIGITKAIRNQIGKNIGDTISVQVEKDEEVREIELPEDFKEELNKSEKAFKFYESLSYSAKRKYYQWITGAKKQETREKRIKEAISKLEENIKIN